MDYLNTYREMISLRGLTDHSLEKRCYGLGKIGEKTKETQLSSIA